MCVRHGTNRFCMKKARRRSTHVSKSKTPTTAVPWTRTASSKRSPPLLQVYMAITMDMTRSKLRQALDSRENAGVLSRLCYVHPISKTIQASLVHVYPIEIGDYFSYPHLSEFTIAHLQRFLGHSSPCQRVDQPIGNDSIAFMYRIELLMKSRARSIYRLQTFVGMKNVVLWPSEVLGQSSAMLAPYLWVGSTARSGHMPSSPRALAEAFSRIHGCEAHRVSSSGIKNPVKRPNRLSCPSPLHQR